MEEQLVRPFVILWLTLTGCILQATTIVPFANLGILADRSDALVMARVLGSYEETINGQTLFRYRLIVEENLKGTLEEGAEFDVQKWEKLIDERWITMWGDLNLYPNSSYLLFLEHQGENLYHPLCFSYYVFEEITADGEPFIVPSPESMEFELVDLHGAEPLYVYHKVPLLTHLAEVIADKKIWSADGVRSILPMSDFLISDHKRAAPSGCTFLTVNTRKVRWTDFPSQQVNVYYTSAGASGCSSSISQTQQAIADLAINYGGININDAGTLAFSPNCADASAVGPDYRTFMDNNLGGYRNVIVQYDDPCNEISNLTNCGGILALGGVYASGTHTFLEETWATAKYGYVIINNGVGTCKCNNLRQILSHELTHSLGFGHISGSVGSANMNPDCCRAISSIDQSCVDYSYPLQSAEALLPAELVSFEGIPGTIFNDLNWSTASEINVEKFLIERADQSDLEFQPIAEVKSKGNTIHGHFYQWTDRQPSEDAFYRLRSVDYDGEQELSKIITIKRREFQKPLVYPTQVDQFINLLLPTEGDKPTMHLYSVNGTLLFQKVVESKYDQLSVASLQSGWYYLQLESKKYTEVFRFFKS